MTRASIRTAYSRVSGNAVGKRRGEAGGAEAHFGKVLIFNGAERDSIAGNLTWNLWGPDRLKSGLFSEYREYTFDKKIRRDQIEVRKLMISH